MKGIVLSDFAVEIIQRLQIAHIPMPKVYVLDGLKNIEAI